MSLIGWIDEENQKPMSSIAGFYKLSKSSQQGLTQDEHYITVNAYVKLLFIELSIIDMYLKQSR